MLIDRDWKDVDLIEDTAKQIFGNNIEFGKVKELDSPYPQFDWPLKLYGAVDALLVYDRSILTMGILRDGEEVYIGEFTDAPIIRGFASTEPENLLSNFRVLDEVAKRIMQESK